jgi:hypothetical protein
LIYEEKRRFIGIFVKPWQNSTRKETHSRLGRPADIGCLPDVVDGLAGGGHVARTGPAMA